MSDNRRLKRKVRNSYFISTVSISLVLFLLGSVGYLIITAIGTTDRIRDNIPVFVMLSDNYTEEQRQQIVSALEADDDVRDIKFVSKEEAAREFSSHEQSNFEEFLGYNPLPDSYELKFSADDPQDLADFEKKMTGMGGVDEVVYQKTVVETIGPNIRKFNLILLFFGGSLLLISLILLNNTIRVSIFAKRYQISTMKLVGATRWFITKPFVRSALAQGLWAGLIASIMFFAVVWALHGSLPEIRFGYGNDDMYWIVGGMFLSGILISVVFTIFAVGKFVRLPTSAVHYY